MVDPAEGTSGNGEALRKLTVDELASLDSMEGIARSEPSPAPELLDRLPKGAFIYAIYPGLLAALTIGLAATWLATLYSAPAMLFALLMGMAFHFLHQEGRCIAGIEFAARSVLRIGVALLGVRITFEQIASLGLGPVLTVVAGVVTTIALGIVAARLLGLNSQFGVLSGGAVAICGASAALAISSVLPKDRNLERDTILTVVVVTTLSTIAMIIYPLLSSAFDFSKIDAGIFLGGTIHDVAQVVGAGYSISPETGDVATYVKLLRVAMLLPVVFLIAFGFSMANKKHAKAKVPLPYFLFGFAILVVLNSFDILPAVVVNNASSGATWCLVTAIAALGMKTSFKDLTVVGWRPIAMIVGETIWIAALVIAALHVL